MEIEVEVTDDDIRDGVKDMCRYCPIALAIRRKHFDARVEVYPSTARFWPSGNRSGDSMFGDLPDEAMSFIEQFDKGKSVSPFTFKLNLT